MRRFDFGVGKLRGRVGLSSVIQLRALRHASGDGRPVVHMFIVKKKRSVEHSRLAWITPCVICMREHSPLHDVASDIQRTRR